ncbi:MAG: mRNA cap guanine-N7 methyltransferase [Lichina confinis]|nr:MAG: mRNA cap guanine-N7 methyltransferase [Lichina confinis]
MYDPARDVFRSASETEDTHDVEDGDANKPVDCPATANVVTPEPLTSLSSRHSPAVRYPEPQSNAGMTDSGATKTSEVSPAPTAKGSVDRTVDASEMAPASTRKRQRSGAPEDAERTGSSPTAEENRGRDVKAGQPEEADARPGADDADVAPSTKKRRVSPLVDQALSNPSPIPLTAANLPRIPRRKVAPGAETASKPKRRTLADQWRRDRSRSPRSRRRSRSPVRATAADDKRGARPAERRRSRSPIPPRRTPSPRARSPPRKLKRPGGASRLTAAEKEALRKQQVERQEAQVRASQLDAAARGTHEVVREHYNAVPERGRDWRNTKSTIRGLRSFNNWVKSTLIQKFSPDESHGQKDEGSGRWAEGMDGGGLDPERRKGLMILDIGCGKGGDLGKWQQAPQAVELYVGVDPAEVSIEQARDRYRQMGRDRRGPDRHGDRRQSNGRQSRGFHAEFFVADGFGGWLGDIPLIQEVGIDGAISSRWGGGGFDVVSMMFCMHYAFESEDKVRGMLRNVAGSLKKGGRFLGVIPDSDVITRKVTEYHQKKDSTSATADNDEDNEKDTDKDDHSDDHRDDHQDDHKDDDDRRSKEAAPEAKDGQPDGELPTKDSRLEWGNDIYRVQFPAPTPKDGIFRPPFGWKYSYFLEEAVEGVPEYVVPWEAFRA